MPARLALLLALAAGCTPPERAPADSGAPVDHGADHASPDDVLYAPEAPEVYELATTHRLVIYLNFDGVTVEDCGNYCSSASTDESWAIGEHFGASVVDFAPYSGSAADRDTVVTVLEEGFAAWDVEFTRTRPAAPPYTMVVISDSDVGPAAGVAPLDCDNRNASDIGFVYGIGDTSPTWIGQAAAHELGHSFGLAHVSSTADYMQWTSSGDAFTVADYDDDHPTWKCFDGDVQDAPSMLTAVLGAKSDHPPESWTGTFVDDDGSPHEDAIEAIADAGITSGCVGGAYPEFCPEDAVTRGQMVVFLDRALDLPASATDHFTDDDGAWYEDAANAAADAGITLGCGDGLFCGGDEVTRAQMASFLTRAMGYPPSTTDHFTDDDGSPHEADIDSLADAGVTNGCGDGLYCPGDVVTRGQMASFLGRALGLVD